MMKLLNSLSNSVFISIIGLVSLPYLSVTFTQSYREELLSEFPTDACMILILFQVIHT